MSHPVSKSANGDELLDLVHAPLTVETLADGWVRVKKADLVGVGATPYEAGQDLLSKLTVVITRLKCQS